MFHPRSLGVQLGGLLEGHLDRRFQTGRRERACMGLMHQIVRSQDRLAGRAIVDEDDVIPPARFPRERLGRTFIIMFLK